MLNVAIWTLVYTNAITCQPTLVSNCLSRILAISFRPRPVPVFLPRQPMFFLPVFPKLSVRLIVPRGPGTYRLHFLSCPAPVSRSFLSPAFSRFSTTTDCSWFRRPYPLTVPSLPLTVPGLNGCLAPAFSRFSTTTDYSCSDALTH